MLISQVKSGQRWVSEPPPSQWSTAPLGKTTQKMKLLVVLHGEDKSLVALAPGWDRAVEPGCVDPVLGAGFGSEPLSCLGHVWGVISPSLCLGFPPVKGGNSPPKDPQCFAAKAKSAPK